MKYVLPVVLALVVIGGGVWYAMRDESAVVPPRGAAASAQGGGFGAAQEEPLVIVDRVRREELSETVEALGTALANESVTLTAKVTDTVSAVSFEDGDYVEAGEILVQLTNQEEEALLAEAEANLEDAEAQLRRVEDLAEQGLAPRSELDVARTRAAAAQARLDSIVARLRDRLIRAPFSGLLGFRQVSPGTLVQPSTPITTLDDISTIKLDFTVPESFIGDMKPGSRVVARSVSYPGREFEGVVRTVGSRVDPITRAVPVRAHIPNEDRALRPGMLLTVEVVTQKRMALVVPESAVFQVQDRAYVYRVGPDHVARQHQIQVGARRFGIVEVTAGLEEGDLIVAEGIIKLRDGVRVRFEGAEQEISDSATSELRSAVASG
ncbi:MAG TPA: efflux RND transporter periplasmic adaptor subunit [Gammaproteobacteria bacterium]